MDSAERELVRECLRGDAAAWDRFFDLHHAPVCRYILTLSATLIPEDAEEIAQETFLSAIRNLGGFRGASSARTWLFRIAGNRTRDTLEMRSAAKRGGGAEPIRLDAPRPDGLPHVDPPDPGPGPDSALLAAEQGDLIRHALDTLGDPCREILELRYFGDLSYEEISAHLRLNPKTVSSRLSKCLDRLEELLRPIRSAFSV